MSAKRPRTTALLLLAVGLGLGCTSTSSSSGPHWPWTKPKPAAADDAKKRDADVLGTPAAPKQAKAGVNKPWYPPRDDGSANVTLRTPRILDDRELERAAR